MSKLYHFSPFLSLSRISFVFFWNPLSYDIEFRPSFNIEEYVRFFKKCFVFICLCFTVTFEAITLLFLKQFFDHLLLVFVLSKNINYEHLLFFNDTIETKLVFYHCKIKKQNKYWIWKSTFLIGNIYLPLLIVILWCTWDY